MDTKRLLTSVLIAVALMLAFSWFFRGNNGAAGGGTAAAGPGVSAIFSHFPEKSLAREGDAVFETVTLGNANSGSKDKLSLTVSNVTAGIEQVLLNADEYSQTVKGKIPLVLFKADPTLPMPYSTIGIHIALDSSGKELPYGIVTTVQPDNTITTRPATSADTSSSINATNNSNLLDTKYIWKIESRSPDVVLLATFSADNKPVAEVRKIFHIDPTSYEVTITHSIRNLADKPIHVAIDQTAAPNLPRDDPQSDDRFFHAIIWNSAKQFVQSDQAYNLTQYQLAKVTGGTSYIGQFSDFAKNPYLWAASSNRFFVAITRPLPESGPVVATGPAGGPMINESHHISSASVDIIHYDAAKPSNIVGMIRLMGNPLEVAPGATLTEPLSIYFGPKKRDILNGAAPVAKDKGYDTYKYMSVIQLSTGCYSYCAFEQIVQPILWLLDFLHKYVAFGNYGIAIMILVIVVRALLHPLTRASQINMATMGKKMRDIQPKIEAMKKKYADNKQKQNEEMMRIYRENNVNPAGGLLGCLPMLIQMPIWAALYSGLRTDIDLRHAVFIPGWINDLSNPDTIWPATTTLGAPLFTLPVLGWEIYGLNLLPILLAAVFYFQMKVSLATQPKPADDQQAQMQKMSQYTIFLFPLLLYNAPSGLNLYIFASTMGGLLDTYLVRKTLKKRGILPASAESFPTHEQKNDKD